MNKRDLTRRGFVTQVAASALPLVSAPAEPEATRMTVVCVGAHPDEGFLPNTYVDISSAVEQKKAALFAHGSQDGQGIWRQHHAIMAQWRGREVGVLAAEAFVHLNRDHHTSDMPGL